MLTQMLGYQVYFIYIFKYIVGHFTANCNSNGQAVYSAGILLALHLSIYGTFFTCDGQGIIFEKMTLSDSWVILAESDHRHRHRHGKIIHVNICQYWMHDSF